MKALLIAFLGLLASPGFSQTMVYETSKGSATVHNVNITTDTAVQMDVKPTRSNISRFEIEVWNDDSSDSLRCAFDVGVSTVAGDRHYGREVRPKTGVSWKVPNSVPVYCKVEGGGTGTAVTARAVVTQL